MSKSFGSTGRSRFIGWLCAILCVSFCSCTPPETKSRSYSPSLRFIDSYENISSLSVDDYTNATVVKSWSFEQPASLAEWSMKSSDDDSRTLLCTGTVNLDAMKTTVIDVEVNEINRGHVSLIWSSDRSKGALFRKDVTLGTVLTRNTKRYRFLMLDNKDWTGVISQMNVEIVPQRGIIPQLKAIHAYQLSVDSERLASVLGKAWKIQIGNEVRPALLSLNAQSIRKNVTLPQGSSLRLGYAVQDGVSTEVTFSAYVKMSNGSTQVLFSDCIRPDDPLRPSSKWHDCEIDLSSVAGQTVELELVTETPTSEKLNPITGFAVWAHPEVLAPTKIDRPNIVLVVIDTLRADRLSAYGCEKETSPSLDEWTRTHATLFESVVAPSPWTLPSHVSLFTGLDAHIHGINHQSPAADDLTMIAEILKSHGYKTQAITGGGFVHPQWGFDQGFDSFSWFKDDMGFAEELEYNIAQAVDLVDHLSKQPVFLFFHTYEVHNPYLARQPYFSRLSGLDPRTYYIRVDREERQQTDGFLDRRSYTIFNRGKIEAQGSKLSEKHQALAYDLYDSGVAYTDAQLWRLLSRIESSPGWSGNTVVAITSDHGEMLGEHDLVTHICLYDENLLVPLLIAEPEGRGVGKRVSQQVRLIDVMPTLLELASLKPPSQINGRSLVPLMTGQSSESPGDAWSYAAASNYGISLRMRNHTKYIFQNSVWPSQRESEELYRLDTDPGEAENLATRDKSLAEIRKRVKDNLELHSPGLFFCFVNKLNLKFAGRVSLPRSIIGTMKTSQATRPNVLLINPSTASIHIGPFEHFTIWVEDLFTGKCEIEMWLEASNGSRKNKTIKKLDLSTLRGTFTLEWNGVEFVENSADNDESSLATIFMRRNNINSENIRPFEQDTQMQAQLEALGYVLDD